jgi:hypothetical protein
MVRYLREGVGYHCRPCGARVRGSTDQSGSELGRWGGGQHFGPASVVQGMNDSMILMARMRRGEMIQEADKDKLAARVRRAARQTTRAVRNAGGPVIRLADAKMRPTATGR